ncbi:hypothetical protein IW262DRAFT_1458825 [Armillaria fumosa]|nr:hypothetical protein IW262DRAFT_1458825 [Armillaria fumosa]
MQLVPAGYPIAEVWTLHHSLSLELGALRDPFCAALSIYLAFPNDRRFIKCLVYGVYVIEFMQTMLVDHDTFATFGYGFGDIDALTRIEFYWLAGPTMSAVVACVGQVFYAYQIYVVSKSRIIPMFIICVSSISSVAAVILGIYCCEAGDIMKLNTRKTRVAVGMCN